MQTFFKKTAPNLKSDNPPSDNIVVNKCVSKWISDFVGKNKWLCIVDQLYIKDNFNLNGLKSIVPNFNESLNNILSDNGDPQYNESSKLLYGLIHSRYILTFPGVDTMLSKYQQKMFGTCRRISCNHHPLLPIGLSPNPGESTVKTYCPSCRDVYTCNSKLDGCYFGPYFPMFFVQAHPNLFSQPKREPNNLEFLGIKIEPESEMNRSKYIKSKGENISKTFVL